MPDISSLHGRVSTLPSGCRRSSDPRWRICGLAPETAPGISAPVSLNRCEDALLRYVVDRADEKRFWTVRVLEWDRAGGALESRVAGLDRELRDYAAERGRADVTLLETFGGGRVSMRNLAEHLLGLWTPPKPSPTRQRT